ncbi:hypothetical protein CLOM_g2174 [Closterium sp. NIES-68]|nr:hypothetical protein CLOM_g2174 [Closterium sp. NIES-68]GJP68792.1 hypothetical protein CLOP_g25450 [Closterium sp. NIES-67]
MSDVKSLKLRAGICKRLLKELKSYETEVEKDAARVEEMKASGADSHDIKQQENVLAESRMMVPDCRKRLEAAYYDLESTVDGARDDTALVDTSEFKEALEILAEASQVVG